MRTAFAIAAAMFALAACGGGGSGGKPVSMTTPAATVAALLGHAQGLGGSGAEDAEDIRELIDARDWSAVIRAAHIRAEAAEAAGNTDAAAAWTIVAEGAAAVRAGQARRQPAADRIAFTPGTDLKHGHYRTDGLPKPLAADVKHMPIYRDDDRIFVGIAQSASLMGRLPVWWDCSDGECSTGTFDLRGGNLSDGNNRTAVVEYLEDAAPDDGPTLVRYTQPPVVRIIGGASARETSSVNAAVRLVNAALPEWAKMTIGSPLPGETSTDNFDDEGSIRLSEAGIPENTIFVEFLPCSQWHDGCGSDYAGTAWKSWDSSKRLTKGLIQVNTSVEETNIDTDRDAAILLAHELIHTLGLDHVRASFASIMHSKEYGGGDFRLSQGGNVQPLSLLYPIDREALRALYGELDPGDSPEALGEWEHWNYHIAGHGEHAAYGVAGRNGYAEPWAYGLIPDTDLADNRALSGSAVWNGRLDGITPDLFHVTGAAKIGVRLANLTGRADFTDLQMWKAKDWHTWLDGDFGYTIAVRGNTFRETGGDAGRLTGIFAGRSHEATAGTLERSDLTAAFGAERQ